MEKFLDQFGSFPAKFLYLILFGIVAVLIGVFVWLVYLPKQEEIALLEADLEQLKVELQKAEAYAARYDEFKEELRQVDLKLKEALKKLPEKKEIPDMLDQINESVLKAGLVISSFTPTGESPREFYFEVPIQIAVSGGYHNFAKFADIISKMERIVTLRNISLSPASPEGDLSISCQAVTFRADTAQAEAVQ